MYHNEPEQAKRLHTGDSRCTSSWYKVDRFHGLCGRVNVGGEVRSEWRRLEELKQAYRNFRCELDASARRVDRIPPSQYGLVVCLEARSCMESFPPSTQGNMMRTLHIPYYTIYCSAAFVKYPAAPNSDLLFAEHFSCLHCYCILYSAPKRCMPSSCSVWCCRSSRLIITKRIMLISTYGAICSWIYIKIR